MLLYLYCCTNNSIKWKQPWRTSIGTEPKRQTDHLFLKLGIFQFHQRLWTLLSMSKPLSLAISTMASIYALQSSIWWFLPINEKKITFLPQKCYQFIADLFTAKIIPSLSKIAVCIRSSCSVYVIRIMGLAILYSRDPRRNWFWLIVPINEHHIIISNSVENVFFINLDKRSAGVGAPPHTFHIACKWQKNRSNSTTTTTTKRDVSIY